MPKLKHRKPRVTHSLLLTLLIASLMILLWPISYFLSDGIRVRGLQHRFEMTTGPGWIAFTIGPNTPAIVHPSWLQNHLENHLVWLDASRSSALSYTRIYSVRGDSRFYFPLWMLSLSMTVLLLALIVSHLRHRRNFEPGTCASCGYDLRATPNCCPECGAAAPTS